MGTKADFRVAIVGGGLCGIALGIALQRHDIPFTLYESRGSFTEIGAGINFGPPGVHALRYIYPPLGEKVYKLATRNPPPEDECWMHLLYGAPSGGHADGETIARIMARPTGSLTLHRQELLQLLADEMGLKDVKFNKKLAEFEQNNDGVVLKFADGTQDKVSILVGCDGIHSRVRALLYGEDNPISQPQFHDSGLYRAVLPADETAKKLGDWIRQSNMILGPDSYVVSYPVNGGTSINCGAWRRRNTWEADSWIVPDQRERLEPDFADWGERVRSLLALFPKDTAFWGHFQHTRQPDTFHSGRVILIGDGAHAMPPHQGAGASMAVEDAYVLAEVLDDVLKRGGSNADVEAGLAAVEEVRKPRFSKVHDYSSGGRDWYFDFYNQKLEGEALEVWRKDTIATVDWVMGYDVATEVVKAKECFKQKMSKSGS